MSVPIELDIEQAELIYVWIEKYKNIEKCAYPINRNFEVNVNEVDGIKEVTVKKLCKEYYMHDFDDINVSTVSLLVGKNGVGKSNFLNAIAGGDELEEEDRKMLLIYYDSVLDDYIIENYNMKAKYEKQTELLRVGTNIRIKSGNSKWCPGGPMTNTEYMFIGDFDKYPNANAWEGIPRYGNTFRKSGLDYGLKYLLQSKKLRNTHNEIVFDLDTKRDEYVNVQDLLSAKYPKHKCNFDHMGDDPYGLYPEAFMLRLLGKWINWFREIRGYKYIKLEEYLSQCKINGELEMPSIDELIEQLEIVNGEGKCVEEETSKVKEVCQNIRKILKKLVEKQAIKFQNSFTCSILIEDIETKIDKADIEELFECLQDEEFHSNMIETGRLKVEYSRLSEGEKYKAKLFSCMELGFKYNENVKFFEGVINYKKIILILDEPDAHFHPEWSRCFISDLFTFLKEKYPDKVFQIIISTHSPFMVSDVPCEHILKISSYQEGIDSGKTVVEPCLESTFGANIHSLLRNTFFMNATIGEFALQSVNKIIEKLDKEEIIEEERKSIKRRIDSMGEPIIKRKLQQKYCKRFQKDDELEKTMDELKEQINMMTEGEEQKLDKVKIDIQGLLKQIEAIKKIKEENR